MKWTKIKNVAIDHLDGTKIEIEKVDDCIVSMTFTDGAGNLLRISRPAESYVNGIHVLIPAPPEMIELYALTGKFRGISIYELFGAKYDADDRKREILGPDGGSDDLEIKHVKVPVADNDEPSSDETEAIPF